MPIKPMLKANRNGSLAKATEDRKQELQIAALFAVDQDGKIIKDTVGRFLLNPSTWSESKSTNWNQTNTPGNSDPILQWSSGGPRTVSFQALVTADTSDFISEFSFKPGKEQDPLAKASIFQGTIASAFFKIAKPEPRMPVDRYTNLDISSFLNYYRSLLYPIYDNKDNPNRLKGSPPLVVLYAGSAIPKFAYGNTVSSQQDLWVLSNINIKITKQTPNLAPMEAVVDFQLIQYNVGSFDRRRFHDGT